MALVVFAGQPASGKSMAAQRLCGLLQQGGGSGALEVVVVDEPSLHLTRSASYSSCAQEKLTRASLKSALEHALTRHSVVLLDSLNNIKGCRYEMWCVARTVGTRYCMVHVDTPTDDCRRWNDARAEGERYPPQVFDDLVRRFEAPDSRNRWDAPLFSLRPAGDTATYDAALAAIAAVAAGTSSAPSSAAGAAAATGQAPQPSLATTNPGLLGTNVLHDVDAAAQAVINAISSAQALAGGSAAGAVELGEGAGRLVLDRPVQLAELRRHKRAFLKLATKITFSRVADAATAQRVFADYLRQQLAVAE